MTHKKEMLLVICVCVTLLMVVPTISAEEEDVQILFVETDEPKMIGDLQMNIIKTAIYSSVEQQATVTIYVQDETLTPVGVMIFKTTLLAGQTPIEYGFTVPNECHYDSRVHNMVCSVDFEKTIYVNVFTDSTLTVPLSPELIGVWV
tara:strand:+ start:989 stop:1429 length:441 start_codon:yes stop_codon:yes gene_type:complete